MFEVIPIQYLTYPDDGELDSYEGEDTYTFTALAFNGNDAESSGVLDGGVPDSTSQTRPEDMRSAFKTVTKSQNWCKSCVTMIEKFMVVKGSESSVNDFRCQDWFENSSIYRQAWPKPDGVKPPVKSSPKWWGPNAEDIRPILSPEAPFGPDGLSQWASFPSPGQAKGLKRLGLNINCPICYALGGALIRTMGRPYDHEMSDAHLALKKFEYCPTSFRGYQATPPKNTLCITLGVQYWHRWNWGRPELHHELTTVKLLIDLKVDNPEFSSYETGRFNPKFLKTLLEAPAPPQPESQLSTTAKAKPVFPRSFRLIDVDKACLVEITDPDVKYAAVSYSWKLHSELLPLYPSAKRQNESAKFHQLTPETERNWKKPGSMMYLAINPTVVDYIKIARQLDIPYLWIKSYCVMEDDPIEVADHNAALLDIWSNAYLSFFNAISQGPPGKRCTDGIPGYRRDFAFEREAYNPDTMNGEAHEWPVWGDDEIQTVYWTRDGWTFQDEFLSPRRVYFTDFGLVLHLNCPTITYFHPHPEHKERPYEECCSHLKRDITGIIKTFYRHRSHDAADRATMLAAIFKARGASQADYTRLLTDERIDYSMY